MEEYNKMIDFSIQQVPFEVMVAQQQLAQMLYIQQTQQQTQPQVMGGSEVGDEPVYQQTPELAK